MEDKLKERVPTLLFGPGSPSGWTSADVSGSRGKKPIVAIRELIQNSLDAAVNEGISPARMRFYVKECAMQDIPAIDAYRRAFASAKESQQELPGSLPDNAKAIADEIEACMRQDKCDVLYVLDNGIGLNERRMNALLADGINDKDPKSAGSYGNGHFVVFPVSNLRYVLYGGVSNEGMIGSGHTILASHKDEEGETGSKILGRDGYFAKDLRLDRLFDRYVFPESGEIPDLLRERLEWIKQEWQMGSVVAVTGFNYFREQRKESTLREQIFNAAARSFFEAIEREELVIEVAENGTPCCLDKNTLPDVLRDCREQKRSTGSFLSGSRAYDAWLTVKEGKIVEAETDMGLVEMRVRHPIEGSRTRVELCRNGMWITDRLPRLQNQFGELEAFHCVISLHRNMEVKRLVRKAESPGHDQLNMNLLAKQEEKKRLTRVLEAIRERLRDEVPKLNTVAFRPDDVFVVSVGNMVQGGIRPGMTGTPTVVRRYSGSSEDTGDEGGQARGKHKGKGGGGGRTGEFKRGGNHMKFRAFAVSTGPRSCRVNVLSGEKTQESEIRFALDESIDVTSDASSKESYVILNADTLRLNGRRAEDEQLMKDKEGNVLGILLGGLDNEKACLIEMDYVIPNNISVPDDRQVVLTVEVIRRAYQDRKTEQSDAG